MGPFGPAYGIHFKPDTLKKPDHSLETVMFVFNEAKLASSNFFK